MIRLKDIAERAGVSVMTVSKVLRDAPDVSAKTKARIRALADQLGYVPDSAAQSLRSRTTRFIGVAISATTNPIFARTLLALEERAHELGYDLILAHTLNRVDREEQAIRRLLARRVDGLLISPVYRIEQTAPIYDYLAKLGTPVVILGHKAAFCAQFANVETDDLAASMALTRHLLGLGHRRIAFFTGPRVCPWAVERFEGYRLALREADIDIDDRLVFGAGATIEEGSNAALQMLDERARPTAIQAANDLVAIGAATVLLQQKVRIPEDISIVGFGNILSSEYFRVPLTTARQPKFRQGMIAMEALGKLLAGEPAPPRRLPMEIVIRSSTAPPAARAQPSIGAHGESNHTG